MTVAHNPHDEEAVVTPQPQDAEGVDKVLDFVQAHVDRYGDAPAPRFFLSGSDAHDRVELTEELFDVLKRAAEALGHGQSISILARDQEVTTQQAADLLGLSRPTVVKLIDDGELKAHVPGAIRRKLRLADVIAYRTELHSRRTKFIADTSENYSDEEPAGTVDELLEQARRAK